MNKIVFIPSEGKKLRDPVTKLHIPSEGALVSKSPFWIRRVQEGDGAFAEPKTELKEEKLDKRALKQGDING